MLFKHKSGLQRGALFFVRASIITLVLGILVLLQPQKAAFAASLLFDSFDKSTIDTTKWTKVDTENKLDQSMGQLRLKGGKSSAAFGDPAIYTSASYPWVAGRTLINILRNSVSSSIGPVMHFSSSTFPSNPHQVGYGISNNSTGGVLPTGRFNAVVPGAQVPYLNTVIGGYDNTTAKAIDYMTTTILRPIGSYHLVSGGVFGSYPDATLIWVNDHGSESSLYAGINNKDTQSWVSSSRIVDLTGSFASQYGLATTADGFGRSGSLSSSTVDLQGNHAWSVPFASTTFTTDGTNAIPSQYGRAIVANAGSDGIFEVDMTSPASGSFVGGIIFRYSDNSNYIYFAAHDDRYRLSSVVNGSYTPIGDGSTALFGNGQTKRLRVVAHGNNICTFVNETNTHGRCYQVSFNQTATGVGIGQFPYLTTGAPGISTFDNFAAWPKTVTLPSTVGDFPTTPNSGSSTLVSDTFSDSDSTSLTSHTMDTGNGWTVVGAPSWTINSNAVTPSIYGAKVVTETGSSDIAVSVDVTLPTASSGTTEWFAGLMYRYTDINNYSHCRFLWQSGSPEIELWEVVNGSGSANIFTPPGFMNATNIKTLLLQNTTHNLKCVVVGNQVSAYMDGTLIVQGTTSLATGTKAGITVDNSVGVTSPYAIFDNFTVSDTVIDSVPPPEIDSLVVSNTPTQSAPQFAWTTVVDDAAGTSFYRLYRSTTLGSLGTQINSNGATTTGTYTDNSLTSNGTYYYTARAVDINGNENGLSDNNQVSVVYTGSPSSTPTPIPTSAPSPPGPPVCNTTSPESAPWLYGANAESSSSILLQFSEAKDPVSEYVVEYGTETGKYPFAMANIGGKGTTSYLVQSLNPNKTFYFRVRASNGCATGSWSNELSATTTGKLSVFTNKLETSILEVEERKVETSKECKTYTVTSGDSLTRVALDNLGDSGNISQLIENNKVKYPSLVTNPSALEVGWELTISCDGVNQEQNQLDGSESDIKELKKTVLIKVVDEDKKPVKGAKVTLHSTPRETKSDENGVARFDGVEVGEHRVVIAYQSQTGEQRINVKEDSEVDEVDFTIQIKTTNPFLNPWVIGVVGLLAVALLISLVAILTSST